MTRILTGIQASGIPHLGNLLGSILPAIALSKNRTNVCFFFIADLHALTTIRDNKKREWYTNATAAAWLACGLEPKNTFFYRQSRIPEVCELAWYLSCLTSYPILSNAHDFKDKSTNLDFCTAGLFTYPVLMAADILLCQAERIPVHKDQEQHVKITQNIAINFNQQYGKFFVIPEVQLNPVMLVPGIDGRKMSKSYQNTITIFTTEQEIKKAVMSIQTDDITLTQAKSTDGCLVFMLYSLLANTNEIEIMRNNYASGNYNYSQAKKALFEVIIERFNKEITDYKYYINNLYEVHKYLEEGEVNVRKIVQENIKAIRNLLALH